MARWLRSTTGLYVSFLLCAGLAAAQESPGTRIRFVDGRTEACEIVSSDAEGVTLRLERIPKPVKFPWWQIDREDAEAIRGVGMREGTAGSASPERTLPGLRVRTREGRVFEGVPLPGAPAGDLWLGTSGGKTVVPGASVVSREQIRIPIEKACTPDELFSHLVARIQPATADDFDRLGAELVRAKLPDRAGAILRMAEFLRHPERLESRTVRDLVRLRDALESLEARKAAAAAQESCLAGEYEAALERLDAVERALPSPAPAAALAEVRRLRGLLQELRGAARDERIVLEWHRAMDTRLKARAMDRAVSWAEASAWVERGLPEEVERDVRARFNFSPSDPGARGAWERRPEDPVYKHAVGSGSWLTLKPEIRAPEEWWSVADDASRYGALKGLAIERHLRVVSKELKSCPACGGTGLARGPAAEGEICPACLGTKSQKVLIYR